MSASIKSEMRIHSLAAAICACLLAAPCALPAAKHNPVRGVVTSTRPFLIGSVEERPEAGPIIVVDGDQISAESTPVMIRLTGDNRAILGNDSVARIETILVSTGVNSGAESAEKYPNDGAYFYLTKGGIQYDARKEPLAICARERLYVPSIPGSGTVVIQNDKVQVTLATGTMLRSGTEPCGKAAPLLLTNGFGSGALASSAAGTAAGTAGAAAGTAGAATTGAATAGATATASATATVTATATATAASVGAVLPTAASIGIATASTAGLVATSVASSAPASQSPINPGP